jgi:hypothetical protein
MSRTEHTQPRHLTAADEPRHLTRRRWVAPAVVVGVLLVLLLPSLFVLAATRTTLVPGTRSTSVSPPALASAAPRPALSKKCRRQALAPLLTTS